MNRKSYWEELTSLREMVPINHLLIHRTFVLSNNRIIIKKQNHDNSKQKKQVFNFSLNWKKRTYKLE